MNLKIINTGFFKLDGGAMFGTIPKVIWQKLNPADENNLCTWAMRCLLIEIENRLILVDCGIGDKQDEKFFMHYFLHGNDSLIKSINRAGYSPDDITDVFLTHLHFDHCGGAVKKVNDQLVLAFKNAVYWSNEDHWIWAIQPNPREKASFLKENILPIKESGQLKFVPMDGTSPFPGIDIIFVDGHTDKQMLLKIHHQENILVYAADLIPSSAHIPIPYIMGYDTRPLLTMQEKQEFLQRAADNKYIIIFEHDPVYECCTLKFTEKGVRMDESLTLSEIF
jgi:glyoxylase-like metal-dependent hydrolase (beta-lactamase superfamily II)